jgi:hypothetical protein
MPGANHAHQHTHPGPTTHTQSQPDGLQGAQLSVPQSSTFKSSATSETTTPAAAMINRPSTGPNTLATPTQCQQLHTMRPKPQHAAATPSALLNRPAHSLL